MGIKMTAGCNSGACNHNSSDKTLEVCANRGKCAGNNIVHAEISKVRNSGGGSENVHIGVGAGSKNTSGSNNVFVGTKAGAKSNGSGNIMVGYGCGNDTVGSGNILIGTGKTDANIDNSLRIFRGENSIIEGTFGASGSLNSLTINGDLNITGSLNGISGSLDISGSIDPRFSSKSINQMIDSKIRKLHVGYDNFDDKYLTDIDREEIDGLIEDLHIIAENNVTLIDMNKKNISYNFNEIYKIQVEAQNTLDKISGANKNIEELNKKIDGNDEFINFVWDWSTVAAAMATKLVQDHYGNKDLENTIKNFEFVLPTDAFLVPEDL